MGKRSQTTWRFVPALILALICGGCASEVNQLQRAEATSARNSEPAWISLFNGRDLTGWEIMGGNKEAFYVKDEAIECNGRGGGWIRYATELSNFVLRLEYKISPGGNSGVFLRSQLEGNPAYTGFEVQVLDDHGRPPDKHTSGAIYDVLTPMVNMSKPAGEWNEYVITCHGPLVTVVMNGVKVVDTNFDWFTEPRGKFSIPYAKLPRTGYIGMQDHGNYVWYRNILLKQLPESE